MELFVDFSRVGMSDTFAVPVGRAQRAALSVGDPVTVVGDTVEPLDAAVTAIDDVAARVGLRLVPSCGTN